LGAALLRWKASVQRGQAALPAAGSSSKKASTKARLGRADADHSRSLPPSTAANGHAREALPSDAGPIVRRIMASRRDAYELLLIEEADAWFEYLEATRGQTALRYKELEPWAWARLSQRLRAIRTKKQKLKPAAAA